MRREALGWAVWPADRPQEVAGVCICVPPRCLVPVGGRVGAASVPVDLRTPRSAGRDSRTEKTLTSASEGLAFSFPGHEQGRMGMAPEVSNSCGDGDGAAV